MVTKSDPLPATFDDLKVFEDSIGLDPLSRPKFGTEFPIDISGHELASRDFGCEPLPPILASPLQCLGDGPPDSPVPLVSLPPSFSWLAIRPLTSSEPKTNLEVLSRLQTNQPEHLDECSPAPMSIQQAQSRSEYHTTLLDTSRSSGSSSARLVSSPACVAPPFLIPSPFSMHCSRFSSFYIPF